MEENTPTDINRCPLVLGHVYECSVLLHLTHRCCDRWAAIYEGAAVALPMPHAQCSFRGRDCGVALDRALARCVRCIGSHPVVQAVSAAGKSGSAMAPDTSEGAQMAYSSLHLHTSTCKLDPTGATVYNNIYLRLDRLNGTATAGITV